MELQQILFPEDEKCIEKELYFHTEGKAKVFDTYFNAFSIEKWKKYTIVENIFLRLKLAGKFKVTLLSKEIKDENVRTTIISEKEVETEEPDFFEFAYGEAECRGIYAFQLEALTENSKFLGGAYCSNIASEKIRNVKIGICICTYKREKFIEKNLKILKEKILDNVQSPVFNHLEVFIADNGKTLDINKLQTDKIHIYPNRNLGGAGGFTRGLIEIYKNNDKFGITHALLMDDDVVIETEAITKTYRILSLIKEEYIDAFIGGAMLRIDKPYMQTESGACWNGGALKALKSNLDMRLIENCLYNESEENPEYNAWWYCCFPMNIVREDNLPLPIFIRCDDVEYGLRNMRNLILMNGICVWHEPFENKYSSYLEYYSARNQLIDNAFHCQWYRVKRVNRAILSRCVQEIMFYRYKNVELYLQGIQDYLKGPEWLKEQDGEVLHAKIMSSGYKAQTLNELKENYNIAFHEEDYENSCKITDEKAEKIKRYLTFNGLFLPAKGENCIPMSQAKTVQFYRKKRVLHYDENSNTGFVTQKSMCSSIKYILKMLGMMCQVSLKYKKTQKKYCKEGMTLRTMDTWKDYLKL